VCSKNLAGILAVQPSFRNRALDKWIVRALNVPEVNTMFEPCVHPPRNKEGEIFQIRFCHETGPETRSERANPTKIDRRAHATQLEGSRGPGANPKNNDFQRPIDGLIFRWRVSGRGGVLCFGKGSCTKLGHTSGPSETKEKPTNWSVKRAAWK
jgi:hypothetical protein